MVHENRVDIRSSGDEHHYRFLFPPSGAHMQSGPAFVVRLIYAHSILKESFEILRRAIVERLVQ